MAVVPLDSVPAGTLVLAMRAGGPSKAREYIATHNHAAAV
jgi:hypothetical protein